MALAIMFLAAPIVIYLVLVIAPSGRGLQIAIAVVALLLGYIWLGYLMSWEPLWTGDDRADTYTLAAANIYTIAAVAGGVTALFGRRIAARYPALSYTSVAVLILVITFTPIFFLLGV